MKWNESKKNIDIKLSDMKPNPNNPRKKYNKQEMEELKLSLQSIGQLNNCILDEKENILVGHRRHFAAKELGWKTLRCDIKYGLSKFKKSAIMISSNSTQVHFNIWEHREAIAKIYWDEFLEEYTPNGRDKGYSAFAKEMGMSVSYAKKIIESSSGENKKYYERLKKEGVGADATDSILTAPIHLRGYLTDVAIKKQKQVKDRGSEGRVQSYIRAVKRKAILEESDTIDKRKFRIWIEKIEEVGLELGNHILEKSESEDLKKLEIAIRKHILGFYNKLAKALNKNGG